MEPHDRRFSEFVDTFKSWISRRSEPLNLSRDFWMPDQSCRVCYECDSQFTVFNRRHHCRLCGRVFCAKCTSNSVLVPSDVAKSFGEVGDRIRVCNYCYKRWQQEVAVPDNGIQLASPILSPSPSTASLVSSKSSGTGNSSTSTAGSMSLSTGAYPHASYGSGPNPGQTIQLENNINKQEMLISNLDSVADLGDPSIQLGFCMNRSDDEDDEYSGCHFDSEAPHFETSNEYYGAVNFDEFNQGFHPNEVYPANENTDAKQSFSADQKNSELYVSSSGHKSGNEGSFECDTSSTIYGMEGLNSEPVDFENNKQLWQPPEPENEEDERESTLFDDDDDEEGATGEWGYLRSSNSFDSGEFRGRVRSSEEHKKAMKNVVDGHFRALIAQLLQVENLPTGVEDNRESWLEIITSLSWEAATLLKPDTSKGGGMDPGGYVKVKCIASGRRWESMVVKGVVCKKNVAHRRMSSKIVKPRFLILGGALEYQRVSNSLSSVDTLLQQEMDHLKMAVAKIDAHHPNVLLVEKSVSRYAQEYLLAKNISLVLNIKRPLLERVARCTGAQIVPSIDHLSSQKLGHCDLFHVEKYLEEHDSASQGGKKMIKTLMFFEGCPRPLGCTVLLKGANRDELKKVKHVIQYGVFAAYHLALETSFLADEGASLPELPLKSPIAVALPDRPSSVDRSISTFHGFSNPVDSSPRLTNNVSRPNFSDSMLAAENFRNVETKALLKLPKECKIESLAPVSACSYNDMKAFPLEKTNQAEYALEQQSTASLTSAAYSAACAGVEQNKTDCGERPEVEHTISNGQSIEENSGFIYERTRHMINDVNLDNKQTMIRQPDSCDLGISHKQNNKRDENELLREEFSSSDHQSILVSLSSRCIWKGTVCERSHLFRIKYYGSFDKPLGRFLRDNLFDQGHRCRTCELPPEAHVHCYTHRQGSLTISVRQQELRLPGERDGKIWMWHRCLRCPRINGFPPATRRVVMSDAAWGLSFGKFLELSFSNNAAASRVASCGHSLHRDCLRFYGFGKMVACFRYAPISVHSVYLPPSKLDFNYQHQEWIKNEADEVANKAGILFAEVLNKLRQILESKLKNGCTNESSKGLESKIAELELILYKEKAEFEESYEIILNNDVRNEQPVIDILEINKLRRQLLFQSYYWDQRLICISSLGYNHAVSGVTEGNKVKLGSTDKLADLNISPRPLKGFLSLDAIPLKHQERSLDHISQSMVVQENRDVEKDLHVQPNTIVANNQLDSLESPAIRRVHSDEQMLIVSDISDTFDAKWRGDNSSTLSEASLPNSTIATNAVSVLSDSEERNGNDVSKSFSPALQTGYGNCAEGFSNWIEVPFLNFYRVMNREENAQKVDALNEYNPIHIYLFRELQHQGGARLLLPTGVNDTVIPVYDDEPTSVISYVLTSFDYHSHLFDEHDGMKDGLDSSFASGDLGKFHPFQSVEDMSSETLKSVGPSDDSLLAMSGSKSSLILDPLAYAKALNICVSFCVDGPLGKVKYTVTCYYAKRFDSLRRTCCPSELDFIRSLSRCKKWAAQGGKSNVFFAKSLDDRFIIKQVTKTELESFIKFAPEYFKYLSESISTGCPTCLAKILGIYQITTKHVKGGKESKIDVLVMENLLFGRNLTRLYDLKGSARSRYNPDSSGKNKVLLDQNLIEAMPTSPIFVGNKAKRLLERAVWNDTAFLASIDVMDYSLLVGVDEEKHELVLGIIDFMRQYTWDKHLETWVKASGILGGPKNESPTVISPKQYKKRFRKAMSAYFLVVPDQWSPASIIPSESQTELREDAQHTSNQL